MTERKRFALGASVIGLLIAGAVVAKYCHEAYIEEHDREVEIHNENLRYFPPDLECAPTFNRFEIALQRAVNRSAIRALARLSDDKTTINFDTDLEGGSGCDAEILRSVLRHPLVNRLLKKCQIKSMMCVRQGKGIDIEW